MPTWGLGWWGVHRPYPHHLCGVERLFLIESRLIQNKFEKNARIKSYDRNIKKVLTVKVVKITKLKETTEAIN